MPIRSALRGRGWHVGRRDGRRGHSRCTRRPGRVVGGQNGRLTAGRVGRIDVESTGCGSASVGRGGGRHAHGAGGDAAGGIAAHVRRPLAVPRSYLWGS